MIAKSFDGYFDTLHHRPHSPVRYFAAELDHDVCLPALRVGTLYVHDTRAPVGDAPRDRAFQRAARALPDLRRRATEAAARMLMWPDGRDSDRNRHVCGGGWAAGDGVVFYVARAFDEGRWRKFLCASV
jgi:hypothetical protein